MIISAFAGSGKTHATTQLANAIDLESSDFQWIYPDDITNDVEERKGTENREKNPNFISDYVDAIEDANKKYDFVFIAAQPAVLSELVSRNVPFTVAYPSKDSKDIYIERYINRGNNDNFVTLMSNNFDNFIDDMTNNKHAEQHIEIASDKFILDYLI